LGNNFREKTVKHGRLQRKTGTGRLLSVRSSWPTQTLGFTYGKLPVPWATADMAESVYEIDRWGFVL